MRYTLHGDRRANQRGFRKSDLQLVRQCGTLIDDPNAEVLLLRDKDVNREIGALKAQIQRLERVRGCKIVIADGELVTVVRAHPRHAKQLLRRTNKPRHA